VVAGGFACLIAYLFPFAPDAGKLGGPLPGLSPAQYRQFYQARDIFTKDFTPSDGLGPLFNAASCFECHGKPGQIGGEGRDVNSTGVVRIGKRLSSSRFTKEPLDSVKEKLAFEKDVDFMLDQGGPALQRKSITSEFPDKFPPGCQAEIAVIPKDAELISLRHSPPLFGSGLIEAIPDEYIVHNSLEQLEKAPAMVGRVSPHEDPLTEHSRIGRFGWKAQHATLLAFTADALNTEMGITTSLQPQIKSASAASALPSCLIKYLPREPNDDGRLSLKLSFCQAMFAPPQPGEQTAQTARGEKLFEQLQCAVCHIPLMHTAPKAYVIDPDSALPRLRWLEIAALENQPVRAYSDFLLHKMGAKLADGLPQSGSSGGEWRTTPLWGLRLKKFYLHDGRTSDLEQAILAHGGQAKESADRYSLLPKSQKADLISFLKSL
jgi:CxxC motif-containing protein (DUF1111 family)